MFTFFQPFRTLLVIFLLASISLSAQSNKTAAGKPKVLIFVKTRGYHHTSIPAGVAAIARLGAQNNFDVEATEDSTDFTDDNLRQYKAVVFLSTTMNVLGDAEQTAFEKYIQAGGGFVGIHAAADTEYDWPWYGKMLGAWFLHHPKQQKVTIQIVDKKHPSTSFLPDKWERFDELYSYKSISPDIKVLGKLDETTYEGGKNGDNHPFIWYQEFEGGRSFYTGGGHTKESYKDPMFLRHLLGGIQYAMGTAPKATARK